ncbi:hypothetical protein HGO21_30180 [Acinetobacter sp. CUI P1]|nr:hypothetical protein [Acinetobacter sp. CUI P1]
MTNPMTPERIEEIKRDAQKESETIYGNCSANITNIELLSLLAALEESLQQRDIDHANYKTYYAEAIEVSERLAEAQQTIARQREALEFLADDDNWSWCWVGTEDETVTWIGGTDPQDAARTALGNKEGSDKA